jgi:SAM-dependent methyltransferase
MTEEDEIASINQKHWERMVKEGCGFTRPWLDLDPTVIRRYAKGELDSVPEPLIDIYPSTVLVDSGGKDVLCLASGGGQQSAVFGLMGARVTVLDLTEGQLDGDRKAAAHYGYKVTTLRGDMRDLSRFPDSSFDLVYQAISIGFVPNVRDVYAGVASVLRPGGLYRVGHCNPATQVVESESWDGEGYRICVPYVGGRIEDETYSAVDFRHLLGDIFNGLIAAGFVIRSVCEAPRHLQHNSEAPAGSWLHMLMYVQQYFAIVAKRE